MVLWVLLHACEAFASQLRDSGVHVAMDDYFSSPLLMGCLATHLIFAVGTLRSNRAGVGGALAMWASKNVKVAEKGAMAFLRWGNMSITQWIDKKKFFFSFDRSYLQVRHRAPGLPVSTISVWSFVA